jgi:hypothetical protein
VAESRALVGRSAGVVEADEWSSGSTQLTTFGMARNRAQTVASPILLINEKRLRESEMCRREAGWSLRDLDPCLHLERVVS